MAATLALQTLEDGHKNLIVKLNITGDAAGDVTAQNFIDISTFSTNALGVVPTQCKIMTITANLFTFDMVLLWDATADLLACAVPSGSSTSDFRFWGGLKNNAGAGKTGDIQFTTVGLAANDYGTIVLECVKEYD